MAAFTACSLAAAATTSALLAAAASPAAATRDTSSGKAAANGSGRTSFGCLAAPKACNPATDTSCAGVSYGGGTRAVCTKAAAKCIAKAPAIVAGGE